ncbi:hypothetical protein SESBI_10299, partial [Sesbania bispinosa]
VINHGISVHVLDEMIKGTCRFHQQDVKVRKEYYTRDPNRKVFYVSNYNLYHDLAANWRDILGCSMTSHTKSRRIAISLQEPPKAESKAEEKPTEEKKEENPVEEKKERKPPSPSFAVCWNLMSVTISNQGASDVVKACPTTMGFSFAAGTTDGPIAFDFEQGDGQSFMEDGPRLT